MRNPCVHIHYCHFYPKIDLSLSLLGINVFASGSVSARVRYEAHYRVMMNLKRDYYKQIPPHKTTTITVLFAFGALTVFTFVNLADVTFK